MKENGKVYAPVVRVALKFLTGNEKAPIVYGFFSRIFDFPELVFHKIPTTLPLILLKIPKFLFKEYLLWLT